MELERDFCGRGEEKWATRRTLTALSTEYSRGASTLSLINCPALCSPLQPSEFAHQIDRLKSWTERQTLNGLGVNLKMIIFRHKWTNVDEVKSIGRWTLTLLERLIPNTGPIHRINTEFLCTYVKRFFTSSPFPDKRILERQLCPLADRILDGDIQCQRIETKCNCSLPAMGGLMEYYRPAGCN